MATPSIRIKWIFKRTKFWYSNEYPKNKFAPFGIAEGIEESLARQAKEKGIEDPFKDNYNYKIIQNIEKMLGQYQLLDQPLLIKEEDWLHKDDTSQLNTPVAPQTPQVNVAAAPQINQQTGLTRTEAALLSPSEQQIARKTWHPKLQENIS